MKRAFSLALTALLLAGCTAAPTTSGDAAASAAPAPSPAAENTEATAAASTEPLQPLQPGDEKQYYMAEDVKGNDSLLRYRVADLTDCSERIPCDIAGCTHDSEDCPAVAQRAFGNRLWVLDDNTLLSLQYSDEDFSTTLTLMNRDCQNRRVLATLDGYDLFSSVNAAYTDGSALYSYGRQENQEGIYRVDLENGKITEVQPFSTVYSLPILGTIGRNFVLKTSSITYPEPTGDLEADATALPTGTVTHSLLNVDTGEVRELYTYSSDDWNLDTLDAHVVNGQYYQIDRVAGILNTIDPDTGEVRQITDQLPITEPDAYANYMPQAVLDSWMVFYDLPVIVNVETGEVRQRAELPETYWNGYGHQPSIYLQLQDRLLVDCRYEPYTRTVLGTDGTPYTVETNHIYLGLISADDFLNGVPNYTEVGEYAT